VNIRLKVSVPLAGTSFVVTPEIDFYRSFIHLALFLLCLYFGFFSKPKGSPTSAGVAELDARSKEYTSPYRAVMRAKIRSPPASCASMAFAMSQMDATPSPSAASVRSSTWASCIDR
jgi:hypothetical protein